MLHNLQNFAKFQKIQLDNLVDLEKCCKTHIFLQKSEPIQPKTRNICRNFAKAAPAARSPAGRGPAPAAPATSEWVIRAEKKSRVLLRIIALRVLRVTPKTFCT